MQDKIIAAIAAYLEGTCRDASNEKTIFLNFGSLNSGHYTFEGFCKELATEIAAAIAPLVEAGEVELNRKKYNKSFLDWLDMYFYREKSMGYRSNTTDVFFTVKELEQRYEHANLDKARL